MNDEHKDLERIVEEAHLGKAIDTIKAEILNYIVRRKTAMEGILDYRKKAMEFFEDDEDRVMDFFDHEAYALEGRIEVIDKKIKEFTILIPTPYFGKVDFREEQFGIESIYIGRFGVVEDGSYEPLIVDWRAPIAAMFYAGKLGEVKYNSPKGDFDVTVLTKRQFIIKKEKLHGMFDSAIDVKDEILQNILSSNSGDKLKDIIMTIQSEQDDIIRMTKNKTVVVNGVAGSGKTTIALHRIAFLLYNFRSSLQDKVMILGPNNIFMEYIATVLPSLGETGVNQKTFRDFALEYLTLDSDEILETREYMEKVLGGDEEFIKTILRKTSPKFIKELDLQIENQVKEQELTDVEYDNEIVVSLDEINNMFFNYYKDMPLFRRKNKLKRIIFSKLKEARDSRVRKIQKEYLEKVEKSTKAEIEIHGTSYDFQRRLDIREAVKSIMASKKQLTWLKNTSIISIYTPFINNDQFTNDDLAPLLYLTVKIQGISPREEIKHVVIDEAQDYSMLQFMVIKEITKAISMTIVGDSNQRIIPIQGEVAMKALDKEFNGFDMEMLNLDRSYRSTYEIMEFANKYLRDNKIIPLVRSGETVLEYSIDSNDDLINTINEILEDYEEKEYESIAIITRDIKSARSLSQLLKFSYVKLYDREDLVYKGGKIIIPSYFAKGLEFDGVILISDDSELSEAEEKLKYVMSTRALHSLNVIKIKSI